MLPRLTPAFLPTRYLCVSVCLRVCVSASASHQVGAYQAHRHGAMAWTQRALYSTDTTPLHSTDTNPLTPQHLLLCTHQQSGPSTPSDAAPARRSGGVAPRSAPSHAAGFMGSSPGSAIKGGSRVPRLSLPGGGGGGGEGGGGGVAEGVPVRVAGGVPADGQGDMVGADRDVSGSPEGSEGLVTPRALVPMSAEQVCVCVVVWCVCVCVCVCMHACMHARMHACIHTFRHVCVLA